MMWRTGVPQSIMGDDQTGKAFNATGEKCLIYCLTGKILLQGPAHPSLGAGSRRPVGTAVYYPHSLARCAGLPGHRSLLDLPKHTQGVKQGCRWAPSPWPSPAGPVRNWLDPGVGESKVWERTCRQYRGLAAKVKLLGILWPAPCCAVPRLQVGSTWCGGVCSPSI